MLRAVVLAKVVADDGEIEARLDVIGIDGQRLLQGPLAGRELAEVVIDDAEHVVHVGEHHAARDGLLQMAGRERIIAALEVLSAEGDQLPQLVVHALPVDCWVESVPWITRRTAKAAEFRAGSADWAAEPGWGRADSWELRASLLRAARAQGRPARLASCTCPPLPATAPVSSRTRRRSARASRAARGSRRSSPAPWAGIRFSDS